jgi:hypothetical protein
LGKKEDDEKNSFTSPQRNTFLKEKKIDVKIVKKESHETIKFELFSKIEHFRL